MRQFFRFADYTPLPRRTNIRDRYHVLLFISICSWACWLVGWLVGWLVVLFNDTRTSTSSQHPILLNTYTYNKRDRIFKEVWNYRVIFVQYSRRSIGGVQE
jgi:hypothetical protein